MAAGRVPAHRLSSRAIQPDRYTAIVQERREGPHSSELWEPAAPDEPRWRGTLPPLGMTVAGHSGSAGVRLRLDGGALDKR
jgi:hypothetical protein